MNPFTVALYALGAVAALAVLGLFFEWKKASKALADVTAAAARDAAALFNTCAELAGLTKMLADAATSIQRLKLELHAAQNAPALLESQFDAASDALSARDGVIQTKDNEIRNLTNRLAELKAHFTAELDKAREELKKLHGRYEERITERDDARTAQGTAQIERDKVKKERDGARAELEEARESLAERKEAHLELSEELARVRAACNAMIESNRRGVPEMKEDGIPDGYEYELQRRFVKAIDERAELGRMLSDRDGELSLIREKLGRIVNAGILSSPATSVGMRFELVDTATLKERYEERCALGAKLTEINATIAADADRLVEVQRDMRQYRDEITSYETRVPDIREKVLGPKNFGGRWRLVCIEKPCDLSPIRRSTRTITPASARRRGAGVTPNMVRDAMRAVTKAGKKGSRK